MGDGQLTESEVISGHLLDVVRRLRLRRAAAIERLAIFLRSAWSASSAGSDEQLLAGLPDLVAACLDTGLLAIELGEQWRGPIPPIVSIHERRALASGIDLSTSLNAYTDTHTQLCNAIVQEIFAAELDDATRTVVLQRAFAATQSLFARMLSEVVSVHFDALRQSMSTSARSQAHAARRILAGEPADVPELDYDFQVEHVGVIAWGESPQRALAGVAARLGYRCWIVDDDGLHWAWLGASRGCEAGEVERALCSYPGVFAAIGDSAQGPQGFRETHGYAQSAYRVAQLSGQRITLYAEVAEEARALQDPLHARWLARTYFTPIAEHRDAATLLSTLQRFYEAARNMDKAARSLGNVDRHTVKRRLEKASRIIGCDLRDHHNHMELALRLARLEGREAAESP